MLMLIFNADENHSHGVHSNSVVNRPQVPQSLCAGPLFSVLGRTVSVSFEALARKHLQVSTGVGLSKPQPSKLGDLSVLEHIKIHTQMPPEGHPCKGVSQTPYEKLTHY